MPSACREFKGSEPAAAYLAVVLGLGRGLASPPGLGNGLLTPLGLRDRPYTSVPLGLGGNDGVALDAARVAAICEGLCFLWSANANRSNDAAGDFDAMLLAIASRPALSDAYSVFEGLAGEDAVLLLPLLSLVSARGTAGRPARVAATRALFVW